MISKGGRFLQAMLRPQPFTAPPTCADLVKLCWLPLAASLITFLTHSAITRYTCKWAYKTETNSIYLYTLHLNATNCPFTGGMQLPPDLHPLPLSPTAICLRSPLQALLPEPSGRPVTVLLPCPCVSYLLRVCSPVPQAAANAGRARLSSACPLRPRLSQLLLGNLQKLNYLWDF